MGARDLIIDSAPILAWRRHDPDASFGHAPAHHPRPRFARLSCAYSHLSRLWLTTLLSAFSCQLTRRTFCQTSVGWGGALLSNPSPSRSLDAAYWGLRLIAWIHAVLGAQARIPWNPKNQKNRSCLPPTWTKEELGKRSSIERFFGRVFLFFHLQRPPLCGWSEIASQIALTYAASVIVGLAAQQAGRPDLIRSPKRVLAHLWERDAEF
jgi:hypothetical protein